LNDRMRTLKNLLLFPPMAASNRIETVNGILLSVIAVVCFGCGSGDKKTSATTNTATNTENVAKRKLPATFFDSVMAKMYLNFGQIKKHTLIDASYFEHASKDSTKNHMLSFEGDTIYYPASKHPLVILHYSDTLGVGSQRLLLVFDRQTLRNTDYHLVETDSDIDYSTDDIQHQFKVISNTSFYVDEIYTLRRNREHEKTDKQTTTRQYFRINGQGKINALPEKVISVKMVAKDETE
jgi:hypothetical protein